MTIWLALGLGLGLFVSLDLTWRRLMRASSDDTAINDLEEWVGHAGCVVAFALAAVGVLVLLWVTR